MHWLIFWGVELGGGGGGSQPLVVPINLSGSAYVDGQFELLNRLVVYFHFYKLLRCEVHKTLCERLQEQMFVFIKDDTYFLHVPVVYRV